MILASLNSSAVLRDISEWFRALAFGDLDMSIYFDDLIVTGGDQKDDDLKLAKVASKGQKIQRQNTLEL